MRHARRSDGWAVLACTAVWLGLGAPPAHADAGLPAPGCIELEVNGERVPDYTCISRLLAPAAPLPRAATVTDAERLPRQSPSALGLANRAATQQRMGSSFGVSTQPQRPAPPPVRVPLPVPVHP
ncbi:hypothetical protein KQ945_05875 [Bacillus subtilis subsp. subtilis]|nr:hypothetical protein [Bacillus subtilis subsp. subtilis]